MANTAKISGLLFDDNNVNGQFDSADDVVTKGVTVQLLTPDNTVVQTTTTGTDGRYEFTNFAPGQYKVRFVVDPRIKFSPINVGSDATDSDVDQTGTTRVFTLGEGQGFSNVSAGCYKPALIGDTIFADSDQDGIQDAGENGVSNVTVRLLDQDGTVLATTSTDDNGKYLFSGLEPGDYKVSVVKPDDFDGFSPKNQGTDDQQDSDVNPDTGMTDVIGLSVGEEDRSVDAGLIKNDAPEPAQLGNRVFEDLDRDGIQDSGEPGVPNVRVDLLDSDDNVVGTKFTNQDGNYSFIVDPGTYRIEVTAPDEFSGFTAQNQGTNDRIDSDVNPSNGVSDAITLSSGEINNTLDAGLLRQVANAAIDIEKFVRVEPVGLPPGQFSDDVCDEFGKPQSLIFEYTGGQAITQTAQDDDKATATGATIFDEVVTVSAGDKKGNSFFSQEVELGERVTISADSFGKGKFGSETSFAINGDDPGETQSLTYHTSCSQPIRLGDVIGGLTLVGFEGEDGSTILPVSEPTDDLDADDAPGAEAQVGDNIVFTYVVNNTGDTALSNIRVTDDRLNPEFVEGDDNNNGLLDTDEEWTYTAAETAAEGLQTNIGTAVGTPVDSNGDDLGLDDVSDSDAANYTGSQPPSPPPISGDLCEVLGKPTSLTFLYEPSNVVDTAQEKFEFSGTADDDDIAFIVGGGGKSKGGKSKGGVTGTGQQVSTGETFSVNVDGSNTEITIFDDANGPALQFIEYHTSCSDIIQLGDQIGSITLVGYNGEDGSTSLTSEQIEELIG